MVVRIWKGANFGSEVDLNLGSGVSWRTLPGLSGTRLRFKVVASRSAAEGNGGLHHPVDPLYDYCSLVKIRVIELHQLFGSGFGTIAFSHASIISLRLLVTPGCRVGSLYFLSNGIQCGAWP